MGMLERVFGDRIFFLMSTSSWIQLRYHWESTTNYNLKYSIKNKISLKETIYHLTFDWLKSRWSNWTSSRPPGFGNPRAIFSLISLSLSFCNRFLLSGAARARFRSLCRSFARSFLRSSRSWTSSSRSGHKIIYYIQTHTNVQSNKKNWLK